MKIYAVMTIGEDETICCLCSDRKTADAKKAEYLNNLREYYQICNSKCKIDPSKYWIEELDTTKKILWEC